jgi:hypothetical protein
MTILRGGFATETVAKIVSTYGGWDKSDGMFADQVETPAMGYFFTNIGRTAAIMKELSNRLVFQSIIPTVAEYTIKDSTRRSARTAPTGTR